MIDLMDLAVMVEHAVAEEPPRALWNWCEREYYQPYYLLLHLLAQKTGGPCVELGVEKGRASAAMLLGGAEVWAMDHTPRPQTIALKRTFPAEFHYLERPSLPVPPQVPDGVRVLHVDTEHSFAQAREEFNAYRPKLAVPAVVCFDDTHAQDSQVGHFVSTLPWPTILDDRLHGCGYGVMLYTGDR
jgi:hypothetical protein